MKKRKTYGGERDVCGGPVRFTFFCVFHKMNAVFCLLRQGGGLEASAAACPEGVTAKPRMALGTHSEKGDP